MAKSSPPTQLKRNLSLSLLIFYGIGTILGLGIYVLLGKIAGVSGTLAPFSFLVAAILAGFTALSFSELSSRMPTSAGEVHYVEQAFHIRWISSLVGWMIVGSAIISTSTIVNGYVGYVHIFVDWPAWAIITGLTVLLGLIAMKGIKESAWLVTIITLIELAGIIFVVVVAGDHLADLPARFSEFIPTWKIQDWQAISLGTFLAFFAFIGFEDMVNVSEEVKNPRKNMPRAIIISVLILSVLYVLVALIAGLALTPEQLDQSAAPLADLVATRGNGYPQVISLISLFAIVNGVLVQIIMGTRVLYGMSERNMAPPIFRRINSSTGTPIWGTIIVVATILVLANSFDLKSLAKATNYILLSVFTIVNLALVAIKRQGPAPKGATTFPIGIPVMGFLFSIAVVVVQLLADLGLMG